MKTIFILLLIFVIGDYLSEWYINEILGDCMMTGSAIVLFYYSLIKLAIWKTSQS